MLPGLVLSLPAGWAGRHASDRQLVTAGLVLMALGGGIAALAHGFGLLALGRLITGAGFVFSTLYFTKMVVDWFSGLELATALGILVMSWPFGIAAGQVGHAWLAVAFDWRATFVVASVCCAAGAAAVALAYRSPPVPVGAPGAAAAGLPRDELLLTLLAAAVWGLFNAGYAKRCLWAVLRSAGRHRNVVDRSIHGAATPGLWHGCVFECVFSDRDCRAAGGRLVVRSHRGAVHGDRVRDRALRCNWVGLFSVRPTEAIARTSCAT
jgi:MFS family permease